MRGFVAICVALLTFVTSSSAAERTWQAATWAPRADASYVLETARTIVTANATAETGELTATPGERVQLAIDGRVVYVRLASGSEHTLQLVDTAQKYSADYRAAGSGHYIRSVAPGGTQVVLEDGSRWDMDPRQHFAVAEWQPEDLISVRRANDDDFAFEIDNTTQDDGALANYRIR